jgi:hypothetical protein
MVDRRSLGDVMEMTPEKLNFIKGRKASEATPPEAAPKPLREAVEIEVASKANGADRVRESKSRPNRRTNRRNGTQVAEVSEVLDQVLVPVTVRLPHRMAQALRRAHLEQRLKHAKPDTQQEIVEEALGDWLARQGFWK